LANSAPSPLEAPVMKARGGVLEEFFMVRGEYFYSYLLCSRRIVRSGGIELFSSCSRRIIRSGGAELLSSCSDGSSDPAVLSFYQMIPRVSLK
jgi:hypothetical protein